MSHTPTTAAQKIGVATRPINKGLVNSCVEANGFVYTSGHTSKTVGQAGSDVELADAVKAARESMVALFSAVLSVRGTLDDLVPVKLLGCVNAAVGFEDHPLIMNEASQILFDIFGEENGAHARSALGFSSLPGGATVEIEAIFRLVNN